MEIYAEGSSEGLPVLSITSSQPPLTRKLGYRAQRYTMGETLLRRQKQSEDLSEVAVPDPRAGGKVMLGVVSPCEMH